MAKDARNYDVTVLTGLNAGAELEVTAGRHSIGGQLDDSIILDGVSDTLAGFVLDKDLIKIKPHVNSISAKPGGACAKSQLTQLSLPVRLSLTPDVAIFVSKQAPVKKPYARRKALLVGAAVVAAAFVFSAIQIDLRLNSTSAAPTAALVSAIPPDARIVEEPATPTAAIPASLVCTDCAEDAAVYLREQLGAAGIPGLTVIAEGGAVRVQGPISESSKTSWAPLRADFDAKWSSRVPLLMTFTDAVNDSPLAVASVWMGEPREIKTSTGQTLTLGDTLESGWEISAIENGYVELKRGITTMRVTY